MVATRSSCASSRIAYRGFGYLGYGAAVVQTFVWGYIENWPLRMAPLLSLSSAVAFLAAVRLSYVLFGAERIVFLEKLLAVVLGAVVTAKSAALPLDRCLDVAVLGVGTFLVFGRMGCAAVGCCHGRPAPVGIVYGESHVESGMHPLWIGVRLFPLQLVESGASAALVVLAFCNGAQASFYILGYAVLRFPMEFARGDLRPEMLGATEAQWLSVTLAWGIWLLTATPSALAIALALSVSLALLVSLRRRIAASPWALGKASHLLCLADGLRCFSAAASASFVTNRGIAVRQRSGLVTVGRAEAPLAVEHARVLANWIGHLLGVRFAAPVALGESFELRPLGDATAGSAPPREVVVLASSVAEATRSMACDDATRVAVR